MLCFVHLYTNYSVLLPSVLWCCWLSSRKGIRPVKNLSGEVRCWLGWSKVQTLWNVSENRHQSEICIVINDKSQGSTAKHLSCDGLHYTFITQFAVERIFKISEHLAKLQAEWLIMPEANLPYTFVLKDAELARFICVYLYLCILWPTCHGLLVRASFSA